MDLVATTKRVRIYLKDGEKPAPLEVMGWLHREHATGVTAFRGAAGLGISGRIDYDLTPDVVPQLPVVVEWIAKLDQIERLLPQLKQLVGHALVTAEVVDVLTA